jgi:hypothetical protein
MDHVPVCYTPLKSDRFDTKTASQFPEDKLKSLNSGIMVNWDISASLLVGPGKPLIVLHLGSPYMSHAGPKQLPRERIGGLDDKGYEASICVDPIFRPLVSNKVNAVVIDDFLCGSLEEGVDLWPHC